MTEAREALAHDAEQQRAKILSLMPGPELNALVQEFVFGQIPGVHFGTWDRHDFRLDERGRIEKRHDEELDLYRQYAYCLRCKESIDAECSSGVWTKDRCYIDVPPYSTDPGAAMAVLSKWSEWEVRHHHDDTHTVTLEVGPVSCAVHAKTWELAACQAALLATWKP